MVFYASCGLSAFLIVWDLIFWMIRLYDIYFHQLHDHMKIMDCEFRLYGWALAAVDSFHVPALRATRPPATWIANCTMKVDEAGMAATNVRWKYVRLYLAGKRQERPLDVFQATVHVNITYLPGGHCTCFNHSFKNQFFFPALVRLLNLGVGNTSWLLFPCI